jgi:hypothetical protein
VLLDVYSVIYTLFFFKVHSSILFVNVQSTCYVLVVIRGGDGVASKITYNWQREGDRNIKFFHRKAVWQVRKNKIKGLEDADGNWHIKCSIMFRK